MTPKRKKYKFNYVPDSTFVYGVSPVHDPANESMFILLSNETPVEMKLSTEGEKRLMTGIVLKPNQLINRLNKQTNEEYDIYFDGPGIRNLSQDFFKMGNQTNGWVNHKTNEKIEGITYVESWIVEDPMNDKGNALGLTNLEKDDWIMSAYVENDEVWQMAKNGELRGFSIDSILSFEEMDLSVERENKKELNNKQMEKQNVKLEVVDGVDGRSLYIDGEIAIGNYVYCNVPSYVLLDGVKTEMKQTAWESPIELKDGTVLLLEDGKILEVQKKNNTELKKEKMSFLKKLFTKEKTTVTLSTVETADGTLTYDSLEVGSIVYKDDMTPAANVEFEVEGIKYKTDENGAILITDDTTPATANLGEITTDEGVLKSETYSVGELLTLNGEPYANATIEVEGKTIVTDAQGIITSAEPIKTPEVDLTSEADKKLIANQKLAIENYTKKLADVFKENESLKLQVAELSKQPATTKLKSNEINLDFDKMTALEKHRFNKARFQ